MKTLKISTTLTIIFGVLALAALIFQFLALADIAQNKEDLALEWRITGITMIVIGFFIVTVFTMIGLILRNWNRLFEK
ncbi:MAG: hypothetical protein MUE74_04530 [Bacteroidales bacterium]|jgi:uncharacterized membrane protein|nr:hypothetical protein [Bacteroidales bacterium]